MRGKAVRSQDHRSETPPADEGFQDQVGPVLQHLRSSISAVIEAIPGADPINRPIDLQRALGLRSTLAWQIHKLGSSANPVTEGPPIPGPEALKRFFKAAASRGVSKSLIESAARAVDQLQDFVKAHAGDRSAFDSMVSGLQQAGSAAVDLQHKRAAFKAQGHIWGVRARTHLACAIFHPSATDPDRADSIALRGVVDLKRFRPDARVVISRSATAGNDGKDPYSPVREPIDPEGFAAHGIPLLTEFSTRPAPRFESITGPGGDVTMVITGDTVGNRSRVTCLTGEVLRKAVPRYRNEHTGHEAICSRSRVPCETLIFDLLVHDEVYGGPLSPTVGVYSNAGGENLFLPQEVDRLNLRESIACLGRGPAVLATPHVPRYPEMVEHALQRTGWDGDRLLAYRCRVEYPVLPSTIMVRFDLPDRPGRSR